MANSSSSTSRLVVVCGEVTRIKLYSAKMFFFDILPGSESAMNFVLKSGASYGDGSILNPNTVVNLSKDIEVGVHVEVHFDPNTTTASSSGDATSRVLFVRKLDHAESSIPVMCTPASSSTVELTNTSAGNVTMTKAHRAPRLEFCKFWLNSKRCPHALCT